MILKHGKTGLEIATRGNVIGRDTFLIDEIKKLGFSIVPESEIQEQSISQRLSDLRQIQCMFECSVDEAIKIYRIDYFGVQP